MRLVTLKVRRMPGFKEKGFIYEENTLKEGINVIIGSNGSGKTTSCLAVRKLLWPHHPSVKDLTPVSLHANFQEKEQFFEIEVEGSRHQISCEVGLPPEQNALCYTILLDDVFEAKDTEFANAIARIAYGGCDLEKIRSQFSIPLRIGQREKKQVYEKRRKLDEISRIHLELEREEISLKEIGEQIAQAKKAFEVLEKLKVLRELKIKETLLIEINEGLSLLPVGASYAREEDARLYQEIILKEGGEKGIIALNEQELLHLEEKIKKIQELERSLKEVRHKTLEMEVGFKERFSLLGIDRENFPKLGVDRVGELQRLWECWHAKVCELNEWDARIKAVDSQEAPLYTPEMLREGMRYLHSFIHAEDLKKLKLLLWAGPFLSLALYKYPYFCLGACFFAFCLLALVRKSSTNFFKRSFLALGLPEPKQWKAEAVRQHITKLEAMWGEAVRFFTDKETAQIIAVHKKKCSDEAENLYQGLREAGFPKEKLPWVPFVHELQRASELFIEVKKQEAFIREVESNYHQLLIELGTKNAHESVVFLATQQKNTKRQKELTELIFRKKEILHRCKISADSYEEEWKLLHECVEKRKAYLSLNTEKAAIEIAIKGIQKKLEKDNELLILSNEEIDRLEREMAEKSSKHDQLIELQASIRQKLESASHYLAFEEAGSELKEAEILFDEAGEEFFHKSLIEFVLNRVEAFFEKDYQPEVFKRANFWFVRFTRGAYRLQLMQHCHFAAFDMKNQELKNLDSLSRGTRIQLILAIRLSFMEAAEENGSCLPLFLDEAMSHADDERFHYMAEALLEVAKMGRQIFYFTCQKSCAAAWQQAAGNSSLLNVIDLDKMKQEEICLEFPLFDIENSFQIPSPEGKSLQEYAKELQAHGISSQQPPSSWHVCHFVNSPKELHELALQNVLLYGQFKTLSEKGFIKKPKFIEKGKLAEYFYTLFQIGRGRKLTWEDLEKGGVSEKFIDKIYSCSKQNDNDPKKLLVALQNKAVSGFREKSKEELEESFIKSGCLDKREILDVNEIRAKLWHFASDSIHILTVEEKASFINKLCESFENE